MVKGANNKETGFWMCMKHFVRPKLEQELGRRVKTVDLLRFGLPYWTELNYEAREEWKEKAKEYNKSEEGQHERMLKRLEYHRRKYCIDEPTDSMQPHTSRKLKPSKIIPPSRRYDEVDQYSRKYFAEIDDDFEGKRESDRKEFIDHYQWKFAGKEPESKKDFFYESEMILVTANVYYEDSPNKRMIPSEISILKFSIGRGIYDQRHYILGFPESEVLYGNSKAKAEQNEQITGLLMDCGRMYANVRFDYAQLWDEIKEFTRIDGDGVKLLLLSKDWNIVVGSFDALFVSANEKSFSRIETRFATLEDYFMAVYATIYDVRINDEIKSDVALEMNEPWHRAVFFELMTCDFHAGLKYTEHCQAKSCSLFAANKATFNFFTLYKKHIFPTCEFVERHIPNKTLLSTIEDNFLEFTSQQRPHLQSSNHAVGYSSTKNIPEQSTSVLLPKKRMLKSNVMRETASVCDTGNGKLGAIGVERKTRSTCNTVIDGKDGELGSMSNQIGFHYDVETWLQNQPSLPHTDSQEMGISSRNPHVSVAFPLDKHYPSVDMVTDQQLCSSSQFTSVSAYRPCQKIIGSYPSDKQDSNFGKIHVTKSQKPLNNQSSTSRTEFSNVAISSDVNKISPHNERSEVLVDLSLIDDDGDTELFCDASIPSSFLYGKGLRMPEPQELTSRMSEGGQSDLFLKTSNKVKQTSAPLSKEMGATYNNIKDVQKPYRSQPISICNTYPISSKSSEIFLPKVNQDKIISKEGSTECNLNLPSYPQKVSKSPLPGENLIPERTSGGFCIPNICQRNYSYMRQNRSVTSASSKDMENRQKNTYERVANQMIPPRNPHTSSHSLAQYEQKGRKSEISAKKLQRQSSSNSSQPLIVNNALENKCTDQKVNMEPPILKPLICKEAEVYGWSENEQSSSPDQKFAQWVNSAYFDSDISRSSGDFSRG